jgi:hypothetical protein
MLKPAGGAFQTQTYEHLMARAEESIANFALDHLISGEDKYLERLLENDRVCELSQYDAQQVKSYFQFLIVGSKVPSAQYKGFNVHPKSKDPQDTQRIAVMKERAMLQLRNFKKTRHLVDWIVVYLSDLRKAVSSLEAFQGRTAVPATKQNDQNKSRGWQEKSAAGRNEASEDLVLTMKLDQRSFSAPPCQGCGAPLQHSQYDKPPITQNKCPFRNHPDWNAENVAFSESAAGRQADGRTSNSVCNKQRRCDGRQCANEPPVYTL